MSYDFKIASSEFRWTGDLAFLQADKPYLNYVNTKSFFDRKKLAQLREYVKKIQMIDLFKYLQNVDDKKDCEKKKKNV